MTDEKVVTPATDSAAERPGALANALEESLRKEKARRFRKGDRVSGRVYKIGDTMAFVDLGGKSEGMLDLNEHRNADGTLDIEEGMPVEAIITDVAANGILLKRALVPQSESIAQLMAAHQAGIPVQGKVTGTNKGGLELDLFGLRGFCPASQIDVKKLDDLTPFVGQTLEFRISEISADGKKLVLSRRALLQEEHDKQLAEARSRITPGAVLHGKVARVQPFGAFIDLGGVEGLCHVSEITRGRLFDATQALQPGQDVEVQVIKVEETTDKSGKKVERIALSMKALEKDPWDGASERFAPGTKVTGKVMRLQPFGAFIEVAPGVDGLVHISEIADKRLEHPKDVLKEGDEVTATVLVVEPEKKRLSLSLREKRPEPKPAAERRAPPGQRPERKGPGAGPRPERKGPPRERKPAEAHAEGAPGEQKPSYRMGQVHDTTVEKVEPFGVFVTLPGGGRALVPNNELGVVKNADQKIDYRKVFPAGATLRVAITQIDHRGQIRASRVEAEKADERAMVKEWSQGQKKEHSGGAGFGTFADLLKKANLVK